MEGLLGYIFAGIVLFIVILTLIKGTIESRPYRKAKKAKKTGIFPNQQL